MLLFVLLYVLTIDVIRCKSNAVSTESLEEKVRKLETDKESLILQVSVLTDQVEAQADKIHDLEATLDDKEDQHSDVSTNSPSMDSTLLIIYTDSTCNSLSFLSLTTSFTLNKFT